jgi:glycosyltransferase involved in cell wall biosynthesis
MSYRILTLNYEFPPIGGGASPVTFELCKQLVRMGHQVDVVTMHYGNLPRAETVEGIRVFRTPAVRARPDICRTHELATYCPGAIFKTLGLARKEKYDIIHCHFIVPGGPLAWTVSKCTKIPFLVTCHGSDIPGYNPDRFNLAHRVIRPAWKFLLKRCPMLVSPSQSLKSLILEKFPQANVVVIPNGIYIDRFEVGKKTKSILMCGRTLPRKGFQYVIQAVKQMDLDWQVNIIGDGTYTSELKRCAEGIKTPIKFWGWLDRDKEDFKRLFAESAIFALPSEAENFPSVLLEAMASGAAIITSNASGCPEVVGDAALFVEPRSPEQLREKLQQLIQSAELRRKLSDLALKRVRDFGWERIAEKYVECYEQLIAEKKGRHPR